MTFLSAIDLSRTLTRFRHWLSLPAPLDEKNMRRDRRKPRRRGGAKAVHRPGRRRKSRVGPPALDVAGIRAKTGLSQERFAIAFRISPHTLRNWEQGRRRPEGPARALMIAIDRDPVALLRALET
jgi:putative transcriptional regulator